MKEWENHFRQLLEGNKKDRIERVEKKERNKKEEIKRMKKSRYKLGK